MRPVSQWALTFSHRRGRTVVCSCDSRQSEGDQRPHHHDEVQDVPQVSEVGAVVEDEALVDHLQEDDVRPSARARVCGGTGTVNVKMLNLQ